MAMDARYEEIGILKEIAEVLNESTESELMLSQVLKKLLHLTGLETGWVFLIDESGRHVLAAEEHLPPALSAENKRRMCQGDCWCVSRYYKKQLTKATNIIECKRIEEAIVEGSEDTGGLTHHATVPLRAGGERFGLLNVGSPKKKEFRSDELALLEGVAFQIGTALKRIHLTQREQETVLLAERNRLARDLHDSVNQLLFSLTLTARGGMEMSTGEVRETFGYIQDLAQEALGEMRGLIWQLKPRGLEKGLVSSLKEYAGMLGLTIHAEVTGIASFPARVEEALWRIGQEALANCKKHAQTSIVHLHFKISDESVVMSIRDDGCGFQHDENHELPSLGLKSMKMRTEALKGRFHLKSSHGQGTEITIELPI
ncbi:histidine kinase [Mesobacillus campisalis]|uniref:histidine kinase n=1 Tax=Mesobacillus campisalis TaxID=1408103 RepID=A0A0M2STA8_9BACI|nr:GAF domain-containing sensor histidine kinase [Mesobacillus campisalis]KKK37358.1 histidine kinase [Mesobacillus campisalis]